MQGDFHFYIDNAPPNEVITILRLLSAGIPRTLEQIATDARAVHDFIVQRDRAYSPRRLYDLGLANQQHLSAGGRVLTYALTPVGERVAELSSYNTPFAVELLHYLHFTPFAAAEISDHRAVEDLRHVRKYLWSYRQCCQRMWDAGSVPRSAELAAFIQSKMVEDFPDIDFAQFTSGESGKAGGRFDSSGAGRVITWLRALTPSPISDGRPARLVPREVERFELALLALDDVYRARGYAYGDLVVLTEDLLRQAAGVFFLSTACCDRLIRLAAQLLPQRLELANTLSGTAVRLLRPFTVSDAAGGGG